MPYLQNGVPAERQGWRDEAISLWHRQQGFDLPAVDFDFVLLEYNHGEPVAVLDYKHVRARLPSLESHSLRAMGRFCDGYRGGAVPFFLVFYDPGTWCFRVITANARARQILPAEREFAEAEFVKFLHLLRRRALNAADQAIIARTEEATRRPDPAH